MKDSRVIRGQRSVLRSPDGFTVVEMVMATVIFFIAFTAIMTLMITNMAAGSRSQQRTAMVNAATSYIENIRQLPYASVGTPSGNPAGSLTATTTTVGVFRITITPAVTWINDSRIVGVDDYKQVTLSVVAVTLGPHPVRMTYTAAAIVKQSDTGTVVLNLPTISFTTGSPSEAQVVYNDPGGSVSVGANAAATGSYVYLTNLNFYVGAGGSQHLMKARVGDTPQYAQWSLSSPSVTQLFNWDTRAVDASGSPLSMDGMRIITVEAWDTNGKRTFAQRDVLVDNYPPAMPASIATTFSYSVSAPTNVTSTESWSTALDGTDLADHYQLTLYDQPNSGQGSGSTDPYTSWTKGTPINTVKSTSATPTVQPNNRYAFVVNACSPIVSARTPQSRISTDILVVGVTRPHLWAVSGGSNKTTFNLSPATFPLKAGSPLSLYLYQAASPSQLVTGTLVADPNAWTHQSAWNVQLSGSSMTYPPHYYYQAKEVLTPDGYLGGTPITLWSDIIGPSPAPPAVPTSMQTTSWASW